MRPDLSFASWPKLLDPHFPTDKFTHTWNLPMLNYNLSSFMQFSLKTIIWKRSSFENLFFPEHCVLYLFCTGSIWWTIDEGILGFRKTKSSTRIKNTISNSISVLAGGNVIKSSSEKYVSRLWIKVWMVENGSPVVKMKSILRRHYAMKSWS